MKVWAIRHKPTGAWMPARMFRTARAGWSVWEPGGSGAEAPYDSNPRIFFTLQSARNALAMWLQGVWKQQISSGTYFGLPEYEGLAPDKPVVPRNREDMEIVEGRLKL